MTRDETKSILDIIMRAYPRMKIVETKEDVDLWHECLNDLEYDKAREATINLVKTAKDFPPDIASIRCEYDKLMEEAANVKGKIKTFYQYACGSYPIDIPSGTGWDVWQERAKDGRQAEIFYQCIKQYLRELEGDAMDFVECIKTICRDNDGRIYFKEV